MQRRPVLSSEGQGVCIGAGARVTGEAASAELDAPPSPRPERQRGGPPRVAQHRVHARRAGRSGSPAFLLRQKAREGRETLASVTRNHEARGAGVEARRHTARHRVGSVLGGGADAGTWFIDPCTARTALPAATATPVPIAAHTHQGAFDGVIAASRRAARFSRTSGSSPGSWRVPRVLVAPSPPPSSRAQSSSLLATASGWGGST